LVIRKMYQKIQILKEKGFTNGDILHQTGLDWKTVSKYLAMSAEEFATYVLDLRFRPSVFDPFKSEIQEIYRHPDAAHFQKSSVYDLLEEKHGLLPGSERAFRSYIDRLIALQEIDISTSKRSYHPSPEVPLGHQLQVDFGEYRTASGLKLYIFASVLSASR